MDLFCGGWNFSKLVSVGPTFIREMRVQGTGVCRSLDKILELPFEILWKKDKREIDVEDEDWAAAEEEHRESAVIGMTALSIGKITVVIR